MKPFLPLVWMVWILFFLPCPARLEDTIQLQDGTMLKGRIEELRTGRVSFKDASGRGVSLRPDQVVSVVLDDAPPGIRQGDEALKSKDFDRAIKCYNEALLEIGGKGSRDINRQFVHKKLALALKTRGKLDAALQELKKIRAEGKDSYLQEESLNLALEVAAQKEDKEAVKAIIDEMISSEEPIHGRGELELAKMQLRDSKAGEAQEILGRLALKAGMPYSSEAQIFNLRALMLLKRAGDVEKAARGLVASSVLEPSVGQASHAALAWTLLERAGSDRKIFREALLESLRALSFGPPSKHECFQDHEMALLVAGRANAALARIATRREITEALRSRAEHYYRDLVQGYAATEWGKAAQKELVELGPAREARTGKQE